MKGQTGGGAGLLGRQSWIRP